MLEKEVLKEEVVVFSSFVLIVEKIYVSGIFFFVVVKILKENDIVFVVVSGIGRDGCIIKNDVV